MEKVVNILYRIAIGILILFGILVLALLIRVFAFDRFPVDSDSMEPAITAGDKIGVNKLLFGARIYKNLDFFKGNEQLREPPAAAVFLFYQMLVQKKKSVIFAKIFTKT